MSQVITPIHNLLVIDSQVNNWQSLANAATANTAVLILDSGSDGLTQISDYLTTLAASTADFVPLQSLQIVSHGSAGSLLLGSITLTQSNLSHYSQQLANMGNSLSDTGDILLYGCDVAAGQTGLDFINQFAALTNAEVAASTDLTGSAALSGDWQLEAVTGSIEAASALNTATLTGYTDTLKIAPTADALQFTGSEAVLTIWNTTQEKSFSLDLGLQQSAFLADTALTRNWAISDANLTQFLAGNSVSDTIIYSVVSGSSSTSAQSALVSGGIYDGLTKKAASLSSYGLVTTSSNSLDEFKSPFTNSTQINNSVAAVFNNNVNVDSALNESGGFVTTNASLYAATPADQGYAGTAFGTNLDGKLGSVNIFADQASALNVFRASLNPALPSQLAFAQFGQYKLDLGAGKLSYSFPVAPVFTSGATGSINENAAITTVIYTAIATDANIGDALTYSLGGTDQALLNINATTGAVTLKESADFESAKASYNFNVIANDGLNTTTQAVVVSVNNLNDNAPVFTSGGTDSVDENAAIATVIYSAATTDADNLAARTYTLGGTDLALLNINANRGEVTLKTAANFETKASYNFNVIANDGLNTKIQAVVVSVNNLNDIAPVFTSGGTDSVDENAAIATVIYTATTTDADNLAARTYSLSGTDLALLNINANTGEVTLKTAANFETKASYNFNVIANDGLNTKIQAVVVSVNNLNDIAPVFTSGDTDSVDENAAIATVIYSAATTDADNLAARTYTLGGTDLALLNINANTGEVTLKTAANFEAKASYSFDVIANDGTNNTMQAVVVSVNNLNDTPTGTVTITGTATQNETLTAANTLEDVDGLGTIAYQWLADGTAIDGATTETLILGQAQVGKTITVQAGYTDLLGTTESVSSSATGPVVNVNDAPTGTVNIIGTATQNHILTATNTLADVDGLGTITYQWLADGVAIDGETTSTLTLGQAQVDKTIMVYASYTDQQNTAESMSSLATNVVNSNNAPTGTVTITGTATQNEKLTATNDLADVDEVGIISYQWRADGTAITGATAETMTLGQAEVGKAITVTASYTDGQGVVESVSSSATTNVINVNELPTGTVTIIGIATQNQILTATNTLADLDGLGTINYQWLADGTAIDGATTSTLTLSQAQVGKIITITATYTDLMGTAESLISLATSAVANVNDAPTGAVTITGTAAQDEILTATNDLVDLDGIDIISYQWLADGTAIDGATATTLTLTLAEVGKVITVTASYKDLLGADESVSSAATINVVHVNHLPIGTVTITGTATENAILTAGNSLTDVDGLGTIAYQWLANGTAITGATASTLTLGQEQVGKTITVQAAYTDLLGATENVSSLATGTVANVNDAPTGKVTITGNATQNQTLTAVSTLADVDGLGTIAYKWLAGGIAIDGATASTLTLAQAQVGKTITVKASYTDLLSTAENVISSETSAVANANDLPTGTVTITGTATQNETLTAANTLTDIDGLDTITYQWLANGTAISGAKASTLTLGQAQVGKTITVKAAYIDGQGAAESITSSATGNVANVNDAPTGKVTITGTATQNQTLTATNSLADVDGLDPIAYQWLANGTAISGAKASTLTLGQAQVGKTITVKAAYTDLPGTAESVSSAATLTVANVNDAPTGKVTITGTATQNQILTATNSLADVDGLGTIAYQWLANGTAISGAKASTLTLGQAQVGKTITVQAAYTDLLNTAEKMTSSATANVVNVNDTPTGKVTITGTSTQNQTLAAANTLADVDGLGKIAYQWLANGTAISGATAATLIVGQAQVGKTITVKAAYTDLQGTAESVISTATRAVANVNDAPVLIKPTAISYTDTVFDDTFAAATGSLKASDIDSKILTYGITGGIDNGKGAFTLASTYGVLTVIKATGTYSFVANDAAIETLKVKASIDFTVTASDGLLNNSKTLTITITQQGTTESTGNDTLTGTTGNDKFNGLAGNDSISGLAGNDILNGGLGADTLVGGLGNDSYFIDNINDKVIEKAGEGTDTVNSSITYTLAANVENLTLTGTTAINGTGNVLNNTLTGNAAANTLNGGTGADKLIGGLGNDNYVVDNAGDVVTENANAGTDTVNSSITYTLGNNVENLTLTGTTAINGTGNTLNNTLTGNAAANTLNGGAGADKMIGGLGNDTYVVDHAGDVVTENANAGTDTVNSSITYTLAANVENLTLTGTTAINGTGNTLNNTLTGNAAANTLNGLSGNDTILGLAGNDILNGGLGNDKLTGGLGTDKLTGGTGSDIFVFDTSAESAKGSTRDIITDFTHKDGDKIDLAGIDANFNKTGDQGFTYMGAQAFTGVAGQLNYFNGILAGDTNGDKVADFEIALIGSPSLVSADFVL